MIAVVRSIGKLLLVAVVPIIVGTSAFANTSSGPAELRGAGGAACVCPCEVACGGGVSCKCSGSKGRCVCGAITLEKVGDLEAVGELVLHGSYSSWFDAAPFQHISGALEAVMVDSGKKETLALEFTPSKEKRHDYVLSDSAELESYRAWFARVDLDQPAELAFAASGDNPVSWVIRDGDMSHLNESLNKRLTIDTKAGPFVAFSSDSTLSWEIQNFLRSAVTCLDATAYQGDPAGTRDSLYGWINTVDLLLKTNDSQGALKALSNIEVRVRKAGLRPGHPHTTRLISAFTDVRDLLSRSLSSHLVSHLAD